MRCCLVQLFGTITILGLVGCGAAPVVEEPAPPVVEVPVRDATFAELLQKPRAELAGLADQALAQARKQVELYSQGQLAFIQVPDARLPVVVAGLDEAVYSPERGVSVPPYVGAKAMDSTLARHLARHGDLEAALKFAPTAEHDGLRKLHAQGAEKNYPIEWTRKVALDLHNAQVQLATGQDRDGSHILARQSEVRAALDATAKKGPLGTALLNQGRGVLRDAIRVWRSTDQQATATVAEAELSKWGDVPALTVPLPPGTPRAKVVAFLDLEGGVDAKGRAQKAASPQRALDLLQLPLSPRDVNTVIATFTADDRLADILVTLRPRIGQVYAHVNQLVNLINEHHVAAEEVGTPDWPRTQYLLGDWRLEAALTFNNPNVGGYLRLFDPAQAKQADVPRTAGPLDLDRSFEQTRLRVAKNRRGKLLPVEDSALLREIASAPAELRRSELILERPETHDLLQRWSLNFEPDARGLPLAKIAWPLLTSAGAPQIYGVGSRDIGYLLLVWEDQNTRMELRLPNLPQKRAEFVVTDRTAPEQLDERLAQVRTRDQAARLARLEVNKAQVRLPRVLEAFSLGSSRADIMAQVNHDGTAVIQSLPDGFRATYTKQPASSKELLLQDLIVRCDAADRVVEIRLRCSNASGQTGLDKLIESFAKAGGAAETLPSSWATLWSDLPDAGLAMLQRWQDDATQITVQQDGTGAEVTLRDCPREHADGAKLAPLSFLPRGPEGCELGTARAELLQAWKVAKAEMAGDALLLTPKGKTAFDALLVWFDKDKVMRVAARHRQRPGSRPGEALTKAWGRELPRLGFPRHQEQADGAAQNWANHDDRTRVRMFWQVEGTPTLFTEWKDLAP